MSVNTTHSPEPEPSGPMSLDRAIELALKVPKVRVDREKFLLDQAGARVRDDADRAKLIREGMSAFFSDRELKRRGKKRVRRTALWSSGVSIAAAFPGGPWGAFVGSSTDIVQSLVFSLRLSQELSFLYGYPFFERNYSDQLSDADTDIFLLCLGAMYDVAGSGAGIRTAAHDTLITRSSGKDGVAQVAISKVIYFPVLKAVAKRFGTRLTQSSFKRSAARFIPIAGALSIGSVNFTMMRRGGNRLNNELASGLNYTDTAYRKDRETLKNA